MAQKKEPLPFVLKPAKLSFSKDERGNTIVEMVVAMAIISLALVGFLTQATTNYTSVVESYNRLVATNLAREMIESIRARRDSNWLQGCDANLIGCVSWTGFNASGTDYTFTNSYNPVTNFFIPDYTADSLDGCVNDQTCRLYWHADTGVYNHDSAGGEATPFYRFVSSWPLCADATECGGDGVCEDAQSCVSDVIGWKITSSVRWFDRTTSSNVVLEDYLYQWR